MKPIIREFLDKAPDWIEKMKIPASVCWENGNCMLCGLNYRKIEELYEALKEDYGEVQINKN